MTTMPTLERSQPVESHYSRILLAVDCSDHSNAATQRAVELAGVFGGSVTGLHAFAARLHDVRFRQMEGGLPERYRQETELERQRDVHDELITRGLEVISDSYLDQSEKACADAGTPFTRQAAEGRNWKVILDAATSGAHDLLVLGAQGLGAVRPGLIGTVCERVARRTTIDTLIVKQLDCKLGDGPILVGIDGSEESFGGLLTAIELGRRFDTPVHAVAAHDPYFHYVAFNRIADVLSDEAGEVFRFEEQEKLHEEIIDSGLEKIYQSHLNIAEAIAADEGATIETTLMAGKPYEAILTLVEQLKPCLLVVGKRGIHSDDALDIGGNTQHLLRLADCNLLLGTRTHMPDVEAVAKETISWTEEAEARMAHVPDFVRNMARMAILRFAQDRGHTVVTESIVDEATAQLCPAPAKAMMGRLAEARVRPDLSPPWSPEATSLLDGLADDEAFKSGVRLRAEKLARQDQTGAVEAHHVRRFLVRAVEDAPPAGPVWDDDATAALETVPEGFMRDAARKRIESLAGDEGVSPITRKLVLRGLAAGRAQMASAMAPEKVEAEHQPTLPWDDDAAALMERVPIGFMRRLTAERVEALAAGTNQDRVTVALVRQKLDGWGSHSKRVEPQLPWDSEAWDAISRAPDVVRGMLVKEIEAAAVQEGKSRVNREDVAAARAQWEERGDFHTD